MAGYGIKEARINRERKPHVNACGSCGADCRRLLCDECRGVVGPMPPEMEDEVNHETRTR